MGDSRKKISCRLISRGKKDLARKCLAKKNSYTEEKKNLLRRLLGKILHPCMSGKNYHQRFGKKSPPPPLLLKANGRPLSIKLQLGRFIPGNGKCSSYRWTRWTKSDRDDRDEKGERGSRGDSRGVKPHHCFVTITNIEIISSQNLSMYQEHNQRFLLWFCWIVIELSYRIEFLAIFPSSGRSSK